MERAAAASESGSAAAGSLPRRIGGSPPLPMLLGRRPPEGGVSPPKAQARVSSSSGGPHKALSQSGAPGPGCSSWPEEQGLRFVGLYTKALLEYISHFVLEEEGNTWRFGSDSGGTCRFSLGEQSRSGSFDCWDIPIIENFEISSSTIQVNGSWTCGFLRREVW